MTCTEVNRNAPEQPEEPRIPGLSYGPEGRLLPQHVGSVLRYQLRLPEYVDESVMQQRHAGAMHPEQMNDQQAGDIEQA